MPLVFVGIGSNQNPLIEMEKAFTFFKNNFDNPTFSSIYHSKAVGFSGNDFQNAVVGFETNKSITELLSLLKQQEQAQGVSPNQPSFQNRTIDLDLLLYGNIISHYEPCELPRSDILKYPFVLAPLAEIAPNLKHPILGLTYQYLCRFCKLT